MGKEEALLERFVNGIYLKKECPRIKKALSTEDSLRILEKLSTQCWDEETALDITTEVQKENYRLQARHLLRKIDIRRAKINLFRKISIAASIAILLSMASIFIFSGWDSFFGIDNCEMIVLQTLPSQRKIVTLPDGSTVTLNACSQLSYPKKFKSDLRLVQLKGEAYFVVSKRTSQPFIIETTQFDIRVLGTSFNVKSYDEDEIQSVIVESGRVQIDLPEGTFRLTANEHFILNTNTDGFSKCEEHASHSLSWMKGGLYFNKTPIQDVVRQLSRMYNVDVYLAKNKTFTNVISGQHDNKDLASVLNSLSVTSGFYWKRTNQGIELAK